MSKSSPDFLFSKIPHRHRWMARLHSNQKSLFPHLTFFILTFAGSSLLLDVVELVDPEERISWPWRYLKAVVYDGHDGMVVMRWATHTVGIGTTRDRIVDSSGTKVKARGTSRLVYFRDSFATISFPDFCTLFVLLLLLLLLLLAGWLPVLGGGRQSSFPLLGEQAFVFRARQFFAGGVPVYIRPPHLIWRGSR